MTYSSAWIESGDDEDFAAFLEQRPRIGLLPPLDRSTYCINHVKEWAKLEELPIEHPDYNMVRVPVSKAKLQRFIKQMLGPELVTDDPSTLGGYIWQNCRDDRTYAIAADEF